MISPVEPVRGGGGGLRPVSVLIGVLVIGLAVSVLKPWGTDAARGPGVTATSTPLAAAPPTAEPTPDPVRKFCLAPDGWRIISVESFDDRSIRTWQTIEPVVARSPTDPHIPVGQLVATQVLSIGWCSPIDGTEAELDPVRVRAWNVGADGAVWPIRLRIGTAESARGGEYWPTVRPSGRSEWLPGRYVFAVSGPEPEERWFGIDVIRYEPSGGPTSRPSAPSSD